MMFGAKKDERKSASEAGYMELAGAKKSADCEEVDVPGGVSSELGCCNLFEPRFRDAKHFKCGECEYVKDKTGARKE
jgi:hypothetical protein